MSTGSGRPVGAKGHGHDPDVGQERGPHDGAADAEATREPAREDGADEGPDLSDGQDEPEHCRRQVERADEVDDEHAEADVPEEVRAAGREHDGSRR